MPRGVYDRSKRKSEKKSEKTETEKLENKEDRKASKIKTLLDSVEPVKTKTPRGPKPGRPRGRKTEVLSIETRCRILTNNISTMVEILSLNTDKKIFAEVVTELFQNFNALKSLRLEVFGGKSEEQKVASLNSGLSLSTKPLLPTPNPAA
jgi:hypothetical protein